MGTIEILYKNPQTGEEESLHSFWELRDAEIYAEGLMAKYPSKYGEFGENILYRFW